MHNDLCDHFKAHFALASLVTLSAIASHGADGGKAAQGNCAAFL